MEGLSVGLYSRMRGYWRRKGYQRINGSGRRRIRIAELGSAGGQRRRSWRIRIKPKLRFFKLGSPKKLLVRLRDSYVKMMMRFADSRVISSGCGGYPVGNRFGPFGRGATKEYDEKMIVEIYKSLVAAQGLVPLEAAKLQSRTRLATIAE